MRSTFLLTQSTFLLTRSTFVLLTPSLSGRRAWIQYGGAAALDPSGPKAACIGETSAAACKKNGIPNVFFPEKPGIDGWVDSVLEALQSDSQPVSQSAEPRPRAQEFLPTRTVLLLVRAGRLCPHSLTVLWDEASARVKGVATSARPLSHTAL
eukprot:3841699-Pyramimonas_sp.AAC.1